MSESKKRSRLMGGFFGLIRLPEYITAPLFFVVQAIARIRHILLR
ncbi:hypothetical protein ACFCZD_09445 [Bacillus safensis]